MKKPFILILLSISLCISCTRNTVHLKGQIVDIGSTNAIVHYDGTSSMLGYSKDFIIRTDKNGYFDTIIVLNKPAFYNINRNTLYLTPKDNLTLKITSNNEEAEFQGKGTEANEYMKHRLFPHGGSFLESGNNVKEDFESTKLLIDSLADIRRHELNNLKGVSDEFKMLENARINADVANSYISYLSYSGMLYNVKSITKRQEVAKDFYSKITPFVRPLFASLTDEKLLDVNSVRYVLHYAFSPFGKEWIKGLNFPPCTQELYKASDYIVSLSNEVNVEIVNRIQEFINAMQNRDFAYELKIKLEQAKKLLPGHPAFDIEIQDVNGNTHHLSDFKGKVIYIDFWADWCGPCCEEAPYFDALGEKYKNKNIVFLPISTNKNKQSWLNYLQHNKKKLIQYHTSDLKINDNWSVYGIPRFILIDKNFNIINAYARRPSEDNIMDIIDDAIEMETSIAVEPDIQKSSISVLYLGGETDWYNRDRETGIRERMDAFEHFLLQYFHSVTVMNAENYKPEMSDHYDVTIFDGMPPLLEKQQIIKNDDGNIVKIIPARYLPDNFSAPSITIADISDGTGRRIGTKNDWYCLCLDANAYNVNTEHPIFKGPFKTNLTFEKQPIPEDALHYAYFSDKPLPDSVMMWRVQNKGYITDTDFRVGMISRPWGYLDSPDCEYISGGVSGKTVDAVAIGRHGNFLTWGFSASPRYMTEEAKVIFANAIVYISKFGGTTITRKYNDRIATLEYLKELKYLSTKKAYRERLHDDAEWQEEMKKGFEVASAKQKRGETLTKEDKSYLLYYNPQIKTYTYKEFLKRYNKSLVDLFGEDETAYLKYYDENKDYFYGGEGSYNLIIDEDAKAWGISTHDKRLLKKAILCLEKGKEIDRAKRILKRYTLCDFKTPAEWRKWYKKYKNKLFFTESGGWFFMVNETGNVPGNDYSILEKREKDAEVQISDNQDATPDADNPVIITAQAEATDDASIQVNIDMNILTGFHVYNEVSQSDPYIPLKINFEFPEGCTAKGNLIMPIARKFGNTGTTIYEDEVKFAQFINYTKLPKRVGFKVSYQCCDSHVCMPPQEKEFNLVIKTNTVNE